MKSFSHIVFLLVLVLCLGITKTSAQWNGSDKINVVDSLPVRLQNYYPISSLNIIYGSDSLFIRQRLISREYYSIDYKKGIITLSDTLHYSILDTLVLKYKSIDVPIIRNYKKRELVVRFDSKFGDTIKVLKLPASSFSAESIFGSKMEKSGTLIRGFSVGTNKDFTLQSGLKLQLSGKLSDEIEIVAALTDQNSPIQPDGNTERLDELEKVFVQIKHKNAVGTFGDYDLVKKNGEFGIINRKLQGLYGEFDVDNISGFFAMASSRGKFNNIKLTGQDGVQGPYKLVGVNNERDIIIIAGSEKIYLDGELVRRGENNEYIIDYSNAQVTFTSNKLITSATRISIDYEYSDRQYTRNFIGGGLSGKFFNNNLKISFQYFKEGDDKDSPIDITLSDSDKQILQHAGNDRNKAIKTGVSLAAPDSLGRVIGSYEERDTVIVSDTLKYYVYAPGGDNSHYNVTFSFAGEGKGSYTRESIGNFRFVGKGNGSYSPVIYLPFPEQKQFAGLNIESKPFEKLTVNLELAGSSVLQNQFSTFEDAGYRGYARNFYMKLEPTNANLFNINFGKIGFAYKDRFTESTFSAPDRFNSVEYDRDYNLSSSPTNVNETLRELSMEYLPYDKGKFSTSLGYVKKGDSFSSTRSNSSLSFNGGKNYSFLYNFDYTSTDNVLLNSYRLYQKGNGFYKLDFMRVGGEYISETRKEKPINKDSINATSFGYDEMNPYIEISEIQGLDVKLKYTYRTDMRPISGVMTKEAESWGGQVEFDYKKLKFFNTNLNVTVRNKSYSDEFKKIGSLDNQSILIRWKSGFNFGERFITGDLFYDASTQKQARMERVFVKVEKGKGTYIYLGDLNNNGVADEREFTMTLYDGDYIPVTVPTDKLYPVIDVKASTRWRIKYDSFGKVLGFAEDVFNALSSESQFRVEENSTISETEKIYLLDFSSFMNDSTTLKGSNFFQQDVFLFEDSQELSFRLRYNHRRSLTQYSAGAEHGFVKEQSLRVRFKMVKEIALQGDIVYQSNTMAAPVTSGRNRDINGVDYVFDMSYRPDQNIEAGFVLKAGVKKDFYPTKPTELSTNGEVLRFNYTFSGNGRLRIELERNELIANNSENSIPFELTQGNQLGKNYFWKVNFDFRISANLQSSAGYDGRILGGGKAIHTARAEVRAFF